MRSRTKEIVREQTATLAEALRAVCDLPPGDERAALLAQMQELALICGETIERLEGVPAGDALSFADGTRSAVGLSEAKKAVALLEAFCEAVYEAAAGEEARVQPARMEALLRELTEHAAGAGHSYDVVFLPYSASMWDCMETVYQAALADAHANVYCIPVPWYDRRQDGSFGERHYEDMLFPADIQVTHYDAYVLSDRRPEYAFIHNPFDDRNYVTSVEPAFYSDRLKAQVDTLIYIPYFAYPDPNARLPESHRLLPAYLNCDYLLMQTQQMKNDVSDVIPREKILVAGSPKAERLARKEIARNALPLPRGLREAITGKKVIFYNTSINMILQDKDRRLDKLEEFIELVKRFDNLFVIWRPHPLIESTIEAMLPKLKARYEALKRKFDKVLVKKGQGYLDQTGDSDLAVAIADCYIGENESSMVDLFRFIDKPRFFTDWRDYYQPGEEEMQAERVWRVCEADGFLWFVSWPSGTLGRLSLRDKHVEEICRLPETDLSALPNYLAPVFYEGKIYLPPYQGAEALLIYDTETGVFSKRFLQAHYVMSRFDKAYLHKGKLVLSPVDYPAVVIYDIARDSFSYYEEGIRALAALAEEGEISPSMTGFGSLFADGKLYLGSFHSNGVLVFDADTGQSEVYRAGDEAGRYCVAAAEGDVLYLADWYRLRMVRFRMSTGESEIFSADLEGVEIRPMPARNNLAAAVVAALDCGREILLVPNRLNETLVFEKESGRFRRAYDRKTAGEGEYASPVFEMQELAAYSCGARLSDGRCVAFSSYDFSLVFFDPARGESGRVPVRIPSRLTAEVQCFPGNLYEFGEHPQWPLTKYLSALSRDLLHKRRGAWRPLFTQYLGAGEEVYAQTVRGCLPKAPGEGAAS